MTNTSRHQGNNLKKVVVAIGMVLLCLASCKVEDELPDFNPVKSAIVWEHRFERRSFSSIPHFYKNSIIVGHPSKNPSFYMAYRLNRDNGDTIWASKVHTIWDKFVCYDNRSSVVHKDIVFFAYRSRLFALSAETGEVLWHNARFYTNDQLYPLDDYIYRTAADYRSFTTLYRYNIHTGIEETVFTIKRGEYGSGYIGALKCPRQWIHPNGDKILIMYNRCFTEREEPGTRMDILAWNLSADSMLWYREGLDYMGSKSQPAIEENRVYFFGRHHAHCIDAVTGKSLWNYFIGDGPYDKFISSSILIAKDKLIIKPDNDYIHAVDKVSGARMWRNMNVGIKGYLLHHHRDTLWMQNEGITAIDLRTGKILINRWNNMLGEWKAPIIHHPTQGIIYASNEFGFYAIRIKNMWQQYVPDPREHDVR